MNIAILLTWG